MDEKIYLAYQYALYNHRCNGKIIVCNTTDHRVYHFASSGKKKYDMEENVK